MPISEIKISMKEYKRLVEEDAKKAGKGTIYGNLLSHLSQLTDMTQHYFTYNSEGKQPVLKEKDYDKLIKCYTELAKDCREFLAKDRVKNKLEDKRVNMIKRLVSCIGKDIHGLVDADKTKENTLSDIIKDASTKTVDLTDKKLGSVGGALNNRIPLKSTSGREGFFTKKSTFLKRTKKVK